MFDQLSSIDWSQLHHAYGPASDVPDLLRQLLAEQQEDRLQACVGLWSSIGHQGSRFDATLAAIPFLIEACGAAQVRDKDSCLMLLAELGAPLPEEEHGWTPEEREWAVRCHGAVARGIDTYLQLLADGDLKTRTCAGVVLSQLPQHAHQSVPRLAAIADDTGQPGLLRVGCVFALLELDREACLRVCQKIPLPALDPKDDTPLPMLPALAAGLRVEAGSAPPGAGDILLAALWRGVRASGPDPFAPFRPVPAFVDPRTRFPWRVEPRLAAAAEKLPVNERLRLVEHLAAPPAWQGPYLAACVCLQAVFRDSATPSLGILPASGIPGSESWTAEQRRVLQALHDCDGYWGSMPGILPEYFGLRGSQQIARERLAQALAEPARPVDPERFAVASEQDALAALGSECRHERLEALHGLQRHAPLSRAALRRLAACIAQEQDERLQHELRMGLRTLAGDQRELLARELLAQLLGLAEEGRGFVVYCVYWLGRPALGPLVEFIAAHPELAEAVEDGFGDDAPEISTLWRWAEHAHQLVRMAAVDYARKLGFDRKQESVDLLVAALGDTDEGVRERAVLSLERLAEYRPELAEALLASLQRAEVERWPELDRLLAEP